MESLDIKKLYSDFLNIDFNTRTITSLDKSIPLPLRQLYEIKALYAETIPGKELFDIQDHLLKIETLDLQQNSFTFLMENQGNWICETGLNNDNPQVLFDDKCGDRRIINDSLVDLLTTYALQELTFSLTHISYSHWTAVDLHQMYPELKNIWVDKRYVYPDDNYCYYVLDNEVIFMNANSMTFFGTNSLDKFMTIENRLNDHQHQL